MHCLVTSEIGMNTVEPSVFTIHSVEAEQVRTAPRDVEPLLLKPDRGAVEGVLLLEGLVDGICLRLHVALRKHEDAVVIRPEDSVPCCASGLGIRAAR